MCDELDLGYRPDRFANMGVPRHRYENAHSNASTSVSRSGSEIWEIPFDLNPRNDGRQLLPSGVWGIVPEPPVPRLRRRPRLPNAPSSLQPMLDANGQLALDKNGKIIQDGNITPIGAPFQSARGRPSTRTAPSTRPTRRT